MIARVLGIACVWVDDAGEGATSVPVWTIPTHAADPDAVELPVATVAHIAQRVALVRPRLAAVIAHYPPAVPPRGIVAVSYFAASMAAAPVYDCDVVAHGKCLLRVEVAKRGIDRG